MALPVAVYPDALWDGNEQDTSNDGPADTTIAQAADHNEIAAELQEVQKLSRAGAVRAFRNGTGGTLTKGTLIYFTGFDVGSGLPTVAKARADDVDTLAGGVVIEDVLNNANGNMSNRHVVTGINTAGLIAGNPLFLHDATAGNFQTQSPEDPCTSQIVGRAIKIDASTGEVEFNISEPTLVDNVGIQWADLSSTGKLRIKAKGVLGTNLADVIQDLIPKLATITKEAEGTPGADDIRFTIQVSDVVGNNLAQRCILDVWVSTSSFGSPSGGHTASVDTGDLLAPAAIATTEAFRVQTDAAGVAKIIVNIAGANTLHLMASVNGAEVKTLSGTWT